MNKLWYFICVVCAFGCHSRPILLGFDETACPIPLELHDIAIDCYEGKGSWQENIIEGTSYVYFDTISMKVAMKVEYKDGLRNGNWQFFYPDGTLKASFHYEMGELVNRYDDYYPSGAVRLTIENISFRDSCLYVRTTTTVDPIIGRYDIKYDTIYNKVMSGDYTYYWENGNKRVVYSMLGCYIDHSRSYYHDNNLLYKEEHFMEWKREGIFSTFDAYGELCEADLFREDTLFMHLYPPPCEQKDKQSIEKLNSSPIKVDTLPIIIPEY